jgi:pyruvate/2-oxoglutarate dehydrogenase complex dihydrolipoamide dehydrogenase (E3) component
MAEHFDVAILGAGPGGEHAAGALVRAGRRVLLVERELIGGECTNWACIPSKTLLRPTEVNGESKRAAGTREAPLDWPDLDHYRDYMTSAGDDSKRVKGYEDLGVKVVKGGGRLAGPGRLTVVDQDFEADSIPISTGSDPVIPPIDGLPEAGYWTNREATSLHEIPASVVVIGGGPVGIELAQFMRRFGSEVSIVQGSERLAEREDERVSELLGGSLSADGVDVRTSVHAQGVRRDGDIRVVTLDDGSELRGEQVIVATGRRPRSHDIGLETIGVQPAGHGGIPIDDHCRVATASGPPATAPGSCCSPIWPSTRRAWPWPTCSAGRSTPTTERSPGSSSPIPRWRPWG